LAFGAVALGALPLVGCGTDRSVVPTAPSGIVTAAVPVSRSIVTPESIPVTTTTPITVGALVSGTSCPNLSFTVGTYVFTVSTSTQYTGGTCANIQPGSKVNFSGSRDSETLTLFTVTQLSFVTSTTPTPPTPTPTPTPTPVNTEGTITAIGSGMCPELQFFFGSYAFNVSYATQYSGGACSDLKAGAKVAIVGTKKDTESFIRVSYLTFRQSTPTPTPDPTTPVSAEVTVSSLVTGTSCPNLSFMVGPYTISVSTATSYEYGACANIAANSKLKLTGTRQGDGVIAASKIEFRDGTNPTTPTGQPVEGEGVVTTLRSGTSCPALEFYIGSYLIRATSSTAFDSGACGDLGTGTRVHVKGTLNGDGSVSATRLGVQSQSPGYPVAEGEGRVGSLVSGTTCPALTFMIEEYTVTLSASTTFVGGTCSDVAVGRKLSVRAYMTGDKQALATQIVFKND
jgi:hypothetical protein